MQPTTGSRSTGLLLIGTVAGRRRRTVDRGDEKVEIVRYQIKTDDGTVMVDDFEPPEYLDLTATVVLPIRVSTWIGKSGPRFSLNIDRFDTESNF